MNSSILNFIATDCGLVIAPDNVEVTTNEIEFYSNQIVRECISLVNEEGQKAIKKHFNIDEYKDENQLSLF